MSKHAAHKATNMMDPISFSKSIYLGDRAIKGFEVDSWRAIVKIKIDLISRIRSSDGFWNFYDKEDIEDGCVAFDDVTRFEIIPAGAIPNDYIADFTVESISADRYKFTLESSSTIGVHAGQCVQICVEAKSVGLIDPRRPDVTIRE